MKSMKDTLAKAMGTMFAQVDNVKYDLATGQTGIVTDGGLITLGDDNHLDQNPMDFFSLELPAFAILTPASQIKRGDIIVSNGKAYGFILEGGIKPSATRTGRGKAAAPAAEVEEGAEADQIIKGELSTINVQGHVSRFRPRKVSMMGVTDGLTVVRSFNNFMGNQEGNQSNNMMAQLMPLMMMSKMGSTGSTGFKELLPLMMLSQMGGGASGGMFSNPMMLMALMGDGGIDGLFK